MSKRELLLKKIKENNGIITTREALNLGIHKDILKELTIKEELEKIANGLYALPDENIDEYLYFSYRIPKGIFSHETAAYLQGLSTRMPIVYVMTVKVGDNVSRVKSERDNIILKLFIHIWLYIFFSSPVSVLSSTFFDLLTLFFLILSKEKDDRFLFFYRLIIIDI